MSDTALDRDPPLTLTEIDRRIHFDDDRAIMEVDFSDLHLHDTAEVNAFYDRVEDRIHATGEEKWFFLINYSGSRIDPAAWFAFSRRGKTVNLGHSMGTVRFDASDETRRQIEHDAGTEAFDPNLFADRDAAIARIAEIPSQRLARIRHVPTHTRADFEKRLIFFPDQDIMEVDLHDFPFHHSRDVNDFYDFVEGEIEKTGQRWYFLVNYNNCRIDPEAWVAWAKRGKELNLGGSLGSVRYEAGVETEADIRLRAESQGFRPNIRNTREEALERIAEMKVEAAA